MDEEEFYEKHINLMTYEDAIMVLLIRSKIT